MMIRQHLLAMVLGLIALPAWADRHCGPVLDSYYSARQAALDEQTSCSAAIQTAEKRLEETRTNARICGCTSLIEGLDSAIAATLYSDKAAPMVCDEQRAAVLNDTLDERIKALIIACH